MEPSLYHDEGVVDRDAVKKLKRNMTLDFASGPSAKKPKTAPHVLSSPDLKLLQLASPELERMIIQQNGMVTTTPTPTQFLCPKYVTDEQEAYARGFVDALNELHKKDTSDPNDPVTKPVSSAKVGHGISPLVTSSMPQQGGPLPMSQLATASYPATSAPTVLPSANTLLSSSTSMPTMHSQSPMVPAGVMRLKEEPQTVPSCSSPPIMPIDMEEQEVAKIERKRERNRLAARKCRNRKLERISRLEDRVNELKGQNTTLSSTASTLREQVCKLKQQIMEHVNSGCQVMLSQNVLWTCSE